MKYVVVDNMPGDRRVIRSGNVEMFGLSENIQGLPVSASTETSGPYLAPRPADLIGDGPMWSPMLMRWDIVVSYGWLEVAPVGPQEGNEAGGDDQYGEGYSRRFARALEDGGWQVADITYYVAYDSNRYTEWASEYPPKDLRIDECIYAAECGDLADIGSTEGRADYAYDTVQTTLPTTDETARKLCEDADLNNVIDAVEKILDVGTK